MPQLDVANYAPQLVWLAITFIALYVLMSRIGLPGVSSVIEKRRSRIGGDLDRAEGMKREAEAILAAYELSLAEARRAAQETLRQAIDKLHAEAALRQRETAEALQRDIAAAEARIGEARRAALADLGNVAAEVAQAAARKIAGIEIGAEEAGGMVAAILGERA